MINKQVMTQEQKTEFLMQFQDELSELFKTLPNQFEEPNVNHYKKGLFDAYSIITKILNK